MPDIKHRVVVTASRHDAYRAVAATEGIAQWWTRDGVRGESTVGSKLEFYFGQPTAAAVMEVVELTPDTQVRWRCIEGADEWIGTTLSFKFIESGEDTAVLFAHDGWREATEFMAHCSARWAYFLLSLKALLETGKGTPFPEDLKF
jgi:uncharacterized protein YndB with AHSA1/START domain